MCADPAAQGAERMSAEQELDPAVAELVRIIAAEAVREYLEGSRGEPNDEEPACPAMRERIAQRVAAVGSLA